MKCYIIFALGREPGKVGMDVRLKRRDALGELRGRELIGVTRQMGMALSILDKVLKETSDMRNIMLHGLVPFLDWLRTSRL